MINGTFTVFGFYGVGKTTLCKDHKEYLDADHHYYRFSPQSAFIPYEKYLKDEAKNYDMLLINVREKGIDLAFFPETYELCVQRCENRKQGNFTPSEWEYKAVIHDLQKDGVKIIFLKENEYISDYERIFKMEDFKARTNELEKDAEKIKKKEAELQKLKENFEQKKKTMQEELKAYCSTICFDALIVGAYDMQMCHKEIAPYTTGYCVKPRYNDNSRNPVDHTYCDSVTGNDWTKLPEALCNYLISKKGWKLSDFENLKEESDRLWKLQPIGYEPNVLEQNKSQYLHGHHIANGYENEGFDSIALGKCYGTYSSCTTSAQNTLSEMIIALRGYCPETVLPRHAGNNAEQLDALKKVCEGVYARHGIDSDLSDLSKWAERNPTRICSNLPQYKSLAEYNTEKMNEEDELDR